MTGYTLLCSCGHTVRASVSTDMEAHGNSFVAVRLKRCCPDCAKENADQKQPVQIAKKDDHADTNPLLLSGSAYQIVWANDIRSQSIGIFSTFISRFPSDTRQILLHTVMKLMNQQTKAGWWIENQNNIYGALAMKCENPLEAAVLEMIRSQLHEIRFSQRHNVR